MEKKTDNDQFTYVAVEDFSKMAKSKKDLYFMFAHQLLPPFQECTIEFMKGILSNENRAIKIGEAVKFHMPFYPELSVDKVWAIVIGDVDLIKYFPKYSQKHLPNRDYLYAILSSGRPAETNELLQNALRNRSVYKDRIDDEFIKVSEEWMEELDDVIEIPTTKGRVSRLLKIKTKAHKERKALKKYLANLNTLLRNREKKNERFEDTKEKSQSSADYMQVDNKKK